MADRDSKAAAAEFRELFGMDFDEFTRQAPVKLTTLARQIRRTNRSQSAAICR
jgi:hypothetical protein